MVPGGLCALNSLGLYFPRMYDEVCAAPDAAPLCTDHAARFHLLRNT